MVTRVVHCKRNAYDIYIGRPSIWGNPFSHLRHTLASTQVQSREQAIERYEAWIKTQPELMAKLPELRGKVLGCWCAPQKCHGEVLARLADAIEPKCSTCQDKAHPWSKGIGWNGGVTECPECHGFELWLGYEPEWAAKLRKDK